MTFDIKTAREMKGGRHRLRPPPSMHTLLTILDRRYAVAKRVQRDPNTVILGRRAALRLRRCVRFYFGHKVKTVEGSRVYGMRIHIKKIGDPDRIVALIRDD